MGYYSKQRSKDVREFIKRGDGVRRKERLNPPKLPSQEIDDIINEAGGWKCEKLSQLRAVIQNVKRQRV